jgi:hypothetical protein
MATLTTFLQAQTELILPTSIKTEFERYIKNTEDMKITTILGEALMNKLKAGSYATLKALVIDCTIYWSYDRYLREGQSKNTAFGSVTKTSEYATDDKHQRQLKIDSNVEICHFKERKMWEHLNENKADYPEWIENKTKNISPQIKISIGDRRI